MSKQLKYSLVIDTKTGESNLKSLDGTVTKVDNKFKGLNKISFAGLAKNLVAPLLAIMTFKAALSIANEAKNITRDANEIASKFNTVFKTLKKSANEWTSDFAYSLGKSSDKIKEHTSLLGDILKPLGFTTKEAFKLSKQMALLGYDVASFQNKSDEQVINSFASALTGERESLKSLGIVISEADVKQEAYTSGIAKQGSQLTKQQKALSTVNLLMANSKDAQGDLLRTSSSLANLEKKKTAVIHDLKKTIGESLLPTYTLWNNLLIDLGRSLLGVSNEVDKATQKATEQRSEFAILTGVYTDLRKETNLTDGEKQQLKDTIEELQRIYPDYLKNLDLEKGSLSDIRDVFSEINKNQEKKILLSLSEAEKKDIYASIVARNKDINSYRIDLVKKENAFKNYVNKIGITTKKLDAYLAGNLSDKETNNVLSKINSRGDLTTLSFYSEQVRTARYNITLEKNAIKKYNDELAKINKSYEDLINGKSKGFISGDDGNNPGDDGNNPGDDDKAKQEFKTKEEYLSNLLAKYKESAESLSKTEKEIFEDSFEYVKGFVNKSGTEIKGYYRRKKDLSKDSTDKEFENEVDLLLAKLDLLKQEEDTREKLRKERVQKEDEANEYILNLENPLEAQFQREVDALMKHSEYLNNKAELDKAYYKLLDRYNKRVEVSNERLWEKNNRFASKSYDIVLGAGKNWLVGLTDTNKTASQRWVSFRDAVIRSGVSMFADLIALQIKNSIKSFFIDKADSVKKIALKSATATAEVGVEVTKATTIEGVQEASLLKQIAMDSWAGLKKIGIALAETAAKITAFFSFLGPFAPIATTGVMVGVVALVKSFMSGFADGGYTGGSGGKYTPAGVVHAKEFVMDKEATEGNVEGLYGLMGLLRSGVKIKDLFSLPKLAPVSVPKISYASGGYVSDGGFSSMVSELRMLRTELKAKVMSKVEVMNNIDPLSGKAEAVYKISDKGMKRVSKRTLNNG